MSERVFTVEGSAAVVATPITLADAGLRERSDLQEWVLAHPDILGPDVLVIGFEFDRWRAASGERERDRLDVLGVGSDGRLVVAELKRDRAPDTVEMQAIKYAAMASRFTEDVLVEHYARFVAQRGGATLDEDEARQRLVDHMGGIEPEQLLRPRIVLVAGSFTPVVTSSVVWLREMGLDITLQQVRAYRVFGDKTVVTVSQLFPVADVEEFTVSPQRAQIQVIEERRTRTRDESTVARLIASDALADGTQLTLRPAQVNSDVRAAVQEWIAQDPRRGQAIWHNDPREPLEWVYDGQRYKPTQIVSRVVAEGAGLDRTNWPGPRWWVVDDGRDLPTVARVSDVGAFDWTSLHDVLARVPAGRWTTYGDLAAVVGTAPQPLGGHIMRCPDCPNAQRVLGSDGRPRSGFAWSDPRDQRTQEEALSQDGVQFTNGVADTAQRLRAEQLRSLGEPATE